MAILSSSKDSERTSDLPDTILQLNLTIADPVLFKYLSAFPEPEREERALEALVVGVIAIQSASPTLDTRVVEEKFRQVGDSIDQCLTGFQEEVKHQFDDHFKAGTGLVPASLDKVFGANGSLQVLMREYFGQDGGRVSRLMEKQLGPASSFYKSLDPTNKESVLSRIEAMVQKHLEEKLNAVIRQFSLDLDDSALARLRGSLSKEIQEISQANNAFFAEVRETLGMHRGQEMEAERGTHKGLDFEDALYDRLAELGRQLGDATDKVRGVAGLIERSKVGDYLITLGETSAAPEYRLVVEAKKKRAYTSANAKEELETAKENRGATVGILAFAKGYEPVEVGDFLKCGDDFLVTVDEEALEEGAPLVYLEAAYKIARAVIVTKVRQGARSGLDLVKLQEEISGLQQLVVQVSQFSDKTGKISKAAGDLQGLLQEFESEMKDRLESLTRILEQARPSLGEGDPSS